LDLTARQWLLPDLTGSVNGYKISQLDFKNITLVHCLVPDVPMPNETGRINPPMSRVQKSRSIWGNIEEYLLTGMDEYPSTSTFRIAMYLLEGVLIGLFTYLWLEFAQMGTLYHWLFPAIVSSAIVICHYAITEIIFIFWNPPKRTIGTLCLVSFTGVAMSFSLVYLGGICGFACRIIGSYCPVNWHTSPPDAIMVFFKTVLLPWVVSIFFLTQGILKKEIAKELADIKQINDSLGQKGFETIPQSGSIHDEGNPPNNEGENKSDSFTVPLKEGIRTIDFIDIYFIAVEDHYCRLVFNRKGTTCKEYVRLSLKEALEKLPSGHFAQVHRSYAVNLRHVKHIRKQGQAYQLHMDGSDDIIPASRHRVHIFLPKLEDILS
jgi:hypothetical protein